MTDPTPDPVAELPRDERVAARLARLDQISEALGQVPDLYRERIALYLCLRDDEVPYRDIAEHTDATPEAVRVAVNKAKNQPASAQAS